MRQLALLELSKKWDISIYTTHKSENVRNEKIFTNQYNLCNKTLASMLRNVILSKTDVVHLSRPNTLLYFLLFS